jgi:dTDP-4-dehydrorhamnose reductase
MKILVTGSGGQLGQALAEVISNEGLSLISHKQMDVADRSQVEEIISNLCPDIVIHAAAYTDVDGCQLSPEKAFKVNSIGTKNLAIACQTTNSVLAYISTDFVFDGNKGSPYNEFDRPNPISIYGQSKLAGEWYTSHLLNKFYVIRTAWVYSHAGKNFLSTILRLAEEKKELKVVNDQIGSPTYALDLAKSIYALVKSQSYGLYHVTNSGCCSWYEFACQILSLAKKSIPVEPIASLELHQPAPRPAYSVLDNLCLKLNGFKILRPWPEALQECLRRKLD